MSHKQTLTRAATGVTLLDFATACIVKKMHAQENLPCCLEMNYKFADVSCHPVRVEPNIELFLHEANKKEQ